jgi:hypothetical protein
VYLKDPHNKETSMTKVARKHILAAIENAGRLTFFKKYAIKAKHYINKADKLGEFGWHIAVLPGSYIGKHK